MANQLKMAKIGAILALRQRQWSIRKIAKELGLHRDTVSRHIQACGHLAKQAEAPISSDSEAGAGPDAKQATPEGGAHGSKQATADEAPLGSAVPEPGSRRQARTWLRGDLAAWARTVESGTAANCAQVQKTLAMWRSDADLAGLRDQGALDRLPTAEREDCRVLWTEVDALIRRAGEGK